MSMKETNLLIAHLRSPQYNDSCISFFMLCCLKKKPSPFELLKGLGGLRLPPIAESFTDGLRGEAVALP